MLLYCSTKGRARATANRSSSLALELELLLDYTVEYYTCLCVLQYVRCVRQSNFTCTGVRVCARASRRAHLCTCMSLTRLPSRRLYIVELPCTMYIVPACTMYIVPCSSTVSHQSTMCSRLPCTSCLVHNSTMYKVRCTT